MMKRWKYRDMDTEGSGDNEKLIDFGIEAKAYFGLDTKPDGQQEIGVAFSVFGGGSDTGEPWTIEEAEQAGLKILSLVETAKARRGERAA